MSEIKRAIEVAKEQAWLIHRTFHNTPSTFSNELCLLCEEEMELTANDHADIIQDQEMRWGEEREDAE